MPWTDSHIHLTLFQGDVQSYIEKSAALDIRQFILGGYSFSDALEQEKLKDRFPQKFYTSIGLHPWHVQEQDEKTLGKEWEQICDRARDFDFIGETGLDYFREDSESGRQKQLRYFEKHVELASHLQKPLVLHAVQAHPDILAVLKKFRPQGIGMVHGFSGSLEIAREYIALGFFISIGTGVLSEGYRKLKEAVPDLPLENILIESDAPESGDSNPDPKTLLQVAEKLAALKQCSKSELNAALSENHARLIGQA